MEKRPIIKTPYHFPGVSVFVPMESGMVAIDRGSVVPDTIVPKTEEFTLIRLLANIVILSAADYKEGRLDNPVKIFDPPIEFRVGYSFHDLMKSDCSIEKLKLAYWNGGKWTVINDSLQYEYQILPPETGQVAEFKIWSWEGDPMLAWGK